MGNEVCGNCGLGSCCGIGWRNKEENNDFQANLVETLDADDVMDHYRQGNVLGEGITGSVTEVYDKYNEKFAMKSINLARFNKAQLKELETEIELVRNLDHPNIIKIYRVYKSKKNIYIIMELLTGGELTKRILKREHEIISVASQLLSACKYWHSRNIVHRDLKLENIMFADSSEDSLIKVIDFGLGTWFATHQNEYNFSNRSSKSKRSRGSKSKASVESDFNSLVETDTNNLSPKNNVKATSLEGSIKGKKYDKMRNTFGRMSSASISGSQQNPHLSHKKHALLDDERKLRRIMMSQVGTAYYMAPEVTKDVGYTHLCDVWAIGVIIYMLINHKPPFGGHSEKEIFRNVEIAKPAYDSPNWERISPYARVLVEQLLNPDPAKRITAEQALKSPWFKKKPVIVNNSSTAATSQNGEREGDPEVIVDKEIIKSFQRFVKYTKLKKAALMIIAHKANSQVIKKLRDVFFEIDVYKTGTITLEELRIALKSHGIVGVEVDELFKSLDQDRSGQIRYLEFLAATIETQKLISQDELLEAFDHLDTDKSGYITKRNLRRLLGKQFSDVEVEQMIKESDLTGDNKVSREEFMQLMTTVMEVQKTELMKEVIQQEKKDEEVFEEKPNTLADEVENHVEEGVNTEGNLAELSVIKAS